MPCNKQNLCHVSEVRSSCAIFVELQTEVQKRLSDWAVDIISVDARPRKCQFATVYLSKAFVHRLKHVSILKEVEIAPDR